MTTGLDTNPVGIAECQLEIISLIYFLISHVFLFFRSLSHPLLGPGYLGSARHGLPLLVWAPG